MLNESFRLQPINVRLCGSIPRKELGNIVEDDNDNGDCHQRAVSLRGAPCPLPDCLTSDRRPSYFATTNGSTLAVCDGMSGLVSQPNSRGTAMRSLVTSGEDAAAVLLMDHKPLSPVLEPPKWAVPAKGETRLEVSPVQLMGRLCSARTLSHGCALLVTFSLSAKELVDRLRLI